MKRHINELEKFLNVNNFKVQANNVGNLVKSANAELPKELEPKFQESQVTTPYSNKQDRDLNKIYNNNSSFNQKKLLTRQ